MIVFSLHFGLVRIFHPAEDRRLSCPAGGAGCTQSERSPTRPSSERGLDICP